MKRFLIVFLTLGLVVGSVATAEAGKKKKAKPIAYTYYFHGTEVVGEVDTINNLSAFTYSQMDATEPADPAPKSMQLIDYVVGPNSNCAGNYLYPVWKGAAAGRIVGEMKVTFHTISAPRTVDVRVWPDISAQQCEGNDLAPGEYPAPAAEESVVLPAGPGVTEVVLKVDFTAVGSFMVQITPPSGEPLPGRVLYDSADYASGVEFTCIPAKGSTSCV